MDRSADEARRIARELAALARRARAAQLGMLDYLIEMARMEAENAARPFGRRADG